MTGTRVLLPLLLIVLLGSINALPARAALLDDYNEVARFEITLATAEQELTEVERRLTGPERLRGKDGDGLLAKIAEIDSGASTAQARVTKEIQQTQQLLDSLGPSPEPGQPEEPIAIAGSRKSLQEAMSRLNGYAKRLELIRKRAAQLNQSVLERQRTELTRELLDRYPSPLVPEVAITGVRDFLALVRKIVAAPILFLVEDFDAQLWRASAPTIIAVLIAVFATSWAGRRYLWRAYGRTADRPNPSYGRKVLAQFMVVLLGGVVPACAIAVPVYVIDSQAVITGLSRDIMIAAAATSVRFVLIMAFLRAALAPGQPQWRLLNVADDGASATYRRAFVLMAIVQIGVFLNEATQSLYVSRELEATIVMVITTLIAVNILALVRARNWRMAEAKEPEAPDGADPPPPADDDGEIPTGTLWAVLRGLARLVAVIAPALAAVGYTQFSVALIGRSIDVTIIAGFFYLVRTFIRDLSALALGEGGRVNLALKRVLGQEQAGIERMFFWVALVADVVIFAAAAFFVAITFGASPNAVLLTVLRGLEGFEVGSVVISPASIVAGLLVFAGFLVGTRILRTFLVQRVLTKTHVDEGVRHSIGAGIGYTGMAIAVFAAVGVIGLDLSNLAIIAGALSVGIGFGLQAIVNNFVAGVILLVERPVKVGDWIRVSGHEGTVKRINVRATEIQTFSRQSVIIPNSELISNSLVNFTHRDKYCRIDTGVGVPLDSDPEHVRDALLEVADGHPHVTRWPAPYVLFKDIGASSLDFELRVYIANTEYYFTVLNDMRYGVVHALRRHGIAVAHPQRDVHILNAGRPPATLTPEPGHDAEPAPDIQGSDASVPARSGSSA